MKKTKKTPLLFLLALSLILSFSGCEKTGGGKEETTTKVPVESTEETTEEVWTPHFVKPKYGNFCLVYKGEVLDPHLEGMDYFFERTGGKENWGDFTTSSDGEILYHSYAPPEGHGYITAFKGMNYKFEADNNAWKAPIKDMYINGILPLDCTVNEFEEAVGLPITENIDKILKQWDERNMHELDRSSPYYYYPDGVYYFIAFFDTKTGKMVSIETHFVPKESFERYGVMAFPEE